MMLKSVFTQVLHQSLQIGNFTYGYASVHPVRIICNNPLSEIGLDKPPGIISRYPEIGHLTGCNLSLYSTECIFMPKNSSQYIKGAYFKITLEE